MWRGMIEPAIRHYVNTTAIISIINPTTTATTNTTTITATATITTTTITSKAKGIKAFV